ncbi:MAG: hypothetical protein J1E37_05420 [Prevotella sp.]|nr:hypothetical protein [Prevotella sp.]
MKHNRYTKFFGWFAAATLLLTTSCTDDLFNGNGSNLSDEVTVSFTLAPEKFSVPNNSARRASGEEGENGGHVDYTASHISDGSKADILIYAVYDKNGNLLEHYTDGIASDLADDPNFKGLERPGQTIMKIEQFPVTINLTLKRGEEYSIAFWAQSSKTKAYNTNDLKKVEVIYSEIDNSESDTEGGDAKTTTTPNNDELRDVFCRSVKFKAGEDGGIAQNVYLYRPLAQINVGASGYDYETAVRNARVQYKYSKIRINRGARYLDVVEDKVYTTTTGDDPYGETQTNEAFSAIDFGWAPIPAYVNKVLNNELPPTDPSYTKYDFEDDDAQKAQYEDEEFLKVHLYDGVDMTGKHPTEKGEDGYLEYATLSKYKDQDKDYLSETFKYLSMCYVLTPSTKETSTVLDNVQVWLATDDQGTDEYPLLNIDHVPAQRNWRTNIVGNLLTTQRTFEIKLDTDFAGEYNGIYGGDVDDTQWSGPLANGVYYDGKKDEIQISNVEGLKWLERMVNGKYDYWVYDTNGTPYHFKDEGIKDPTDGDKSDEAKALKARILRATHQNQNPANNGWPKNNNFHFMGASSTDPLKNNQELTANNRLPALVYPAKVRLMADLDLSSYKEKWIPIGFSNNTAETYNLFEEKRDQDVRAFCGQFEGGNHTIYNLSNKRFSASVYDDSGSLGYQQTTSTGPYDKAVQWFSVGLFGQIGQNGSVSNLRLKNVDLLGYCHVGGIAGTVTGQDAFIYNCYVDGGTITASPMYRGDSHRDIGNGNGRTFARGIFAGGIVGYLNVGRTPNTSGKAWDPSNSQYQGDKTNLDPNLDKYASVLNCDVRNLTMRAYRQIGGIVGSLNNNDKITTKDNGTLVADGNSRRVRKLSGNNVTNVTIIADKFQPYDVFFFQENKNAFGWKANQLAWSDVFVGGDPENNTNSVYIYESNSISGNTSSNVIITEFATGIKDDAATAREATIDMIPLNLMPMLSSFFTDEVTLRSNFTGKHSAYRHYNEHEFYSDSRDIDNTKVNVPCDLPNDLSIDWITSSGKVGMYIESINLHGNGGSGRSIVTVEDAKDPNDCVAYIGGRNHSSQEQAKFTKWNQHQTNIESMVFRGQPYAYTGICLAPTSSTTAINLDNVSVYDVYQTLALDNNVNPSSTTLSVSNSNLRGYTVPGANWKKITYTGTTFEVGTSTGNGSKERTCKVEADTEFNGCFFKAPHKNEYFINLSDLPAGKTVTFTNCYATATSTNNKKIDISGKTGCKRIGISSNAQGDPIVKYYDASGNVIE